MKSVKFFLIVLCWTLAPLWVCAEAPPTWSDEFDGSGPPDPAIWTFEQGFVRNEELQWYTNNATQVGGVLVIEARREQVLNPNYDAGSTSWKLNREYAEYTSASIVSAGKYSFQYGRMQVRAKIPCFTGSWPAIWTLGNVGEWPSNGECDILEYYLIGGVPSILANLARGTTTRWSAAWDNGTKPVSQLTAVDPSWKTANHVWTMQWDQENVRLYVDNILMNTIPQSWIVNPVMTWGPQYPFKQPQYILLNLAIGGAGGDPSGTTFPLHYEIDYVRVWEGATNNVAPTDITLTANSVGESLSAGTVVGNLSAVDADPGEVISYSLVAGTGSTNNSQFQISFLSGETKTSVLKTAAVLSYADGATRSIRVRATDIEGATHDKVLTINVLGGEAVEASTGTLSVPEGGTNAFNVRLRVLPSNTVTVNVARVSGDTDLSVNSGSVLYFTPADGTNWQPVVLAAAHDADKTNGLATFSCIDAGGSYLSETVTVYEADDDNQAPVVEAGTNQMVTLGGSSPWTPDEILTAAWYDAADGATLTTNASGYVSQWNDKSGKGHNAIQAGATAQPARQLNKLNGLPTIYFDGGDSLAAAGSNAVRNLFAVFNASGATFAQWRWLYGTLEGTNDVPALFGSSGSANVQSEIPVKSAASNVLRINGVSNATPSYSFAPLADYKVVSVAGNSASAVKGGWAIGTGDAFWLGSIAEIITTDTAMTTETRQQIEGYLAHKWGLSNGLPADHPYKSAAPGAASVTVSLDGTVSDPEGDTISAAWSRVSGPGSVSFGNSNAVDTIATFTAEGVYVLRLTASDGVNQTSCDVTITVISDSDSDGMDDNWEASNFTNTAASDGSGDQDSDGFIDLHEYLAGTSPTNSSSLLILESASAVASGSQVVLTWAGVSGKTYQLLTSTNLMQSIWETNLTGINGVSPMTSVTNNIAESGCFYLIKLE